MNQESRVCQNCKQSFTIDVSDFDFYTQIKVPPPTWCPECRARRRMMYRNERALYKNICKLCRKDTIAMYPFGTSYNVYCFDCWTSDKWDPLTFGQDYDFSRPFFQQFGEFLKKVPRPSVEGSQNLNCPYTNYTWQSKNVYMSSSILYSDNAAYIKGGEKCIDTFDCFQVTDLTMCYECVNCERLNNSRFLINSRDCINSSFLFDCVNCSNCFMSSNQRNQSYMIENVKYSEAEYREKLKEYRLDEYGGMEEAKKKFSALTKNALHKFARITNAVNATGDNLYNAKDVKECFDLHDLQNVSYTIRGWNIKDSMDIHGTDDTQWDYESVNNGLYSSHLVFTANCHTNCLDIRYSDYCRSSSYLFGCISVKKGQYCIFNKQYSKDEYEKLVAKIINQMKEIPYIDRKGRTYKYGEFFPPEICPFAYNETVAQEYFPVAKEKSIEEGFGWKNPDAKNYQITLAPENIPEKISEVNDSILEQIIGCSHKGQCNHQCLTAFRLTAAELQFYKKAEIPIPRLCMNCRHCERLSKRNPTKLWYRQCMCDYSSHKNSVKHQHHPDGKCPNEFETSYATDRPEIVYCESCYNSEVA